MLFQPMLEAKQEGKPRCMMRRPGGTVSLSLLLLRAAFFLSRRFVPSLSLPVPLTRLMVLALLSSLADAEMGMSPSVIM